MNACVQQREREGKWRNSGRRIEQLSEAALSSLSNSMLALFPPFQKRVKQHCAFSCANCVYSPLTLFSVTEDLSLLSPTHPPPTPVWSRPPTPPFSKPFWSPHTSSRKAVWGGGVWRRLGCMLGEGCSLVVICNCYCLQPCYAVTIPNWFNHQWQDPFKGC